MPAGSFEGDEEKTQLISNDSRYVLTFSGGLSEFDSKYSGILRDNNFTPYKNFSFSGKTVIFVEDKGDPGSLEQRIGSIMGEGLTVEPNAIYRVKNQ